MCRLTDRAAAEPALSGGRSTPAARNRGAAPPCPGCTLKVNAGQANGARNSTRPPAESIRVNVLGRRIARDLAQLHPDQVVEPRVQPPDDLLQDLEAELLAVPVDAGPVRHHHRRRRRARSPRPCGPTCRSAVMNWSAPPGGVLSQPPVQSPVQRDDADDAARIGAVETARVLDARRDAPGPLRDGVPEVVRDLRLVDVPHRLQRRHGQLGPRLGAESAGRRHALAGQPDVVQDAQRVGEIGGKLVGGPSRRPLPVLHEPGRVIGVRMAGRRIDHARVRDHLRMNVPVGDHQRAHQLDAVGELALASSRAGRDRAGRRRPGRARSSTCP